MLVQIHSLAAKIMEPHVWIIPFASREAASWRAAKRMPDHVNNALAVIKRA